MQDLLGGLSALTSATGGNPLASLRLRSIAHLGWIHATPIASWIPAGGCLFMGQVVILPGVEVCGKEGSTLNRCQKRHYLQNTPDFTGVKGGDGGLTGPCGPGILG